MLVMPPLNDSIPKAWTPVDVIEPPLSVVDPPLPVTTPLEVAPKV
jgi:hypothetical protein